MTDYALPTFLKEIPDWAKFKELRFINRYDWIAVLMLALGCYFLGEWSLFQTWTGINGLGHVGMGIFSTHRPALSCHLLGKFAHPHVW